ncbi:MAG: hydroxyacid dehydrogenase [Planctomycetes bacterium]|nr:hydroxyacid dehydrogenase [Planctomycetota bacterium]
MHVHIHHEPDEPARKALFKALDNEVRVTWGPEPGKEADYAILVSGRPTAELMTASEHLHTVVIPFAGLPPGTLELLVKHPEVVVHNLHHNAPATAELAIALLLAGAKSVVPVDRRFRRRDWSDRGEHEHAVQLEGRTALVIGYGAIGRRVAKVCAALGLEVRAIARNDHPDPGHRLHKPEELRELLPKTDVLMVCAPSTQETQGMIGESELALLPPDAILVNISRGALVDQRALYDALKQRRLFAAGLDVWWTYPASRDEWGDTAPSDFAFHELDNVVMSPHRGGHVKDTEVRRMRALAQVLNAAARGEEIPHKVDLKAGY